MPVDQPIGSPSYPHIRSFRDAMKAGERGPEMVVIPRGRFVIEALGDKAARSDREGLRKTIIFAAPFALGRYPVTFEEYDTYCADAGGARPEDEGWGRGRRPVINVSWEDAQAYCDWLSEQTGAAYNLPSEAEWEYACRAGTTSAYSFSDDAAGINAHAWFYENSVTGKRGGRNRSWRLAWGFSERTRPVGRLRPNAFGLFDMHGNVWEWVADVWRSDLESIPEDGSANFDPGDGDWTAAVLRGGSFRAAREDLRSDSRENGDQRSRAAATGFRVKRTLADDETALE